jgi:molybdopterin molybdotransferase
MITVDEAIDRVRTSVPRLNAELVPTTATLGRVLTEPVTTLHPLPRFHQSAVDGFAVRHPDIARTPATLPIACVVAAGPRGRTPDLAAGTAARIFTGALLPEGADTIVRQELTSADEKYVTVHERVTRGADVRWEGEELPAGSPLCAPGTRVKAGLIGALVLSGACHVKVVRRPRVRVLVTGDEITPSGLPLGLGQVPDSNGPLISAALTQWGVDSIVVDYVPDRPDAVERALRAAFDDADLVISSGGGVSRRLRLHPLYRRVHRMRPDPVESGSAPGRTALRGPAQRHSPVRPSRQSSSGTCEHARVRQARPRRIGHVEPGTALATWERIRALPRYQGKDTVVALPRRHR